MKQTDITWQDFLVWYQNCFPNLACIAAPYIRILITQSLRSESCLTLRVAYFITRLRNLEDYLDHSQQLDWLSPEAREELIEDLATLGMDTLVEHLSKSRFYVIPYNAICPVTEALSSRLNEYFNNHRAILIDDMESVTGQTVGDLLNEFCLTAEAANVVEHLSLMYVMRFLRFIESADAKLRSIKEQILTPDISVDPLSKRRYLDFRIDVDRQLRSFEMPIPESVEAWLYEVFELFDAYPNYFGK